ncbi:hypothetical protein BDQ17DRAFT_1331047 [Cyathus striatus]|nr:hypothetical protein BDQ17DRAFT_1331047 [Cyathus striatus]
MGEYDRTVGVLLIGVFFNVFLYGLVTYQFLVYYTTKFNDNRWLKSMVFALFVIDTSHTIIGMYNAYTTCVTNYGNVESLFHVDYCIPFLAAATACAALITQVYLCHRIATLTKNIYIIIPILIISGVSFVVAIYVSVLAGIAADLRKFGPLVPGVTAWLALQTVADGTITAVLIVVLSKSHTGFRKTDTILNRLIRGAIQTGLFASFFALGDLFSFRFLAETNFYAMFSYPIGRIYTNTLMDTLNARAEMRTMLNTTVNVNTEDISAYHMPTFNSQHGLTDTIPGPSDTIVGTTKFEEASNYREV